MMPAADRALCSWAPRSSRRHLAPAPGPRLLRDRGRGRHPARPAGGAKAPLAPQPVALAGSAGLPVLQPLSASPRRPDRPATPAAGRRRRGAYGRILPRTSWPSPSTAISTSTPPCSPAGAGHGPSGPPSSPRTSGSGASIISLDEGMDTGGVLARRPCSSTLTTPRPPWKPACPRSAPPSWWKPSRLSLRDTGAQPQDDREATYCHMVRKDDGCLDWTQPAVALERQVRAMRPGRWPGQPGRGNSSASSRPASWIPLPMIRPAPQAQSVRSSRGRRRRGRAGARRALGKKGCRRHRQGVAGAGSGTTRKAGVVPIAAFVNGYRTFPGSRRPESQAPPPGVTPHLPGRCLKTWTQRPPPMPPGVEVRQASCHLLRRGRRPGSSAPATIATTPPISWASPLKPGAERRPPALSAWPRRGPVSQPGSKTAPSTVKIMAYGAFLTTVRVPSAARSPASPLAPARADLPVRP